MSLPTVDPYAFSGSHQASDTMAALYRAKWDDYLTRFAPLETELRDSILSGERMDSALGRTNASVAQQFGLARADAERNLNRYGVQLTGQRKEAHDASFGLAQASTEAALRNRVRQQVEDSNAALIGGVGAQKQG